MLVILLSSLKYCFLLSCGRSRPIPYISHVIHPPAEPHFVSRTYRVIRRHTVSEPLIPEPILYGNAFAARSEESLYDDPLNLGLSVEAIAAEAPIPRARRHSLSAVSILPVVDSTVSAIPSSPEAEVKPGNQNQITFPVLNNESEPDTLVSRAPKHIGETLVKQSLSSKSTMPVSIPKPALDLGKQVANIVHGLGIPCEDTNFHCPIQNNCPTRTHAHDLDSELDYESVIWNPEDDSDLETEPDATTEPTNVDTNSTICQLLVKIVDPAAKVPTRATPESAGYNLYSCENILIPPGTRKPINTGISIAIPPGTYASIAP